MNASVILDTHECALCSAGTYEEPAVKLHSVSAIVIATVLGSPLAGAFIFNHNLNALGRSAESVKLWVLAIGLLIATLSVSTLLPEGVAAQLLILAEALAMYVYAKLSFTGLVNTSAQQARRYYSDWLAVGICVLLLLAALLTMVPVMLFLAVL